MSTGREPLHDSTPGVIVLGSVHVDLVVKAPHLPHPGETVLGGEFYQAAGGKGANQAVAAARCALRPVALIAAIGDDEFGRRSRAQFERENLDCRYVKTLAGAATGVALITVDQNGENAISVASGANARLSPADVDAIESPVFEQASVFLTNLESPLETVFAGLKRARQAGLLTILNPAPADHRILNPEFLQLVDVLTPNAGEAESLLSASLINLQSAQREVGRFRDCGVGHVVVTRGARDAWLFGTHEPVAIPVHRVQAVDTTGAGDAFNGVLAAALAEGQSLLEGCRRASAAAALAVTRPGAQPSLPQRTEIEAWLSQR
jgi:ribokinase